MGVNPRKLPHTPGSPARCQWVQDDGKQCGGTVAVKGEAWCADHRALVYKDKAAKDAANKKMNRGLPK